MWEEGETAAGKDAECVKEQCANAQQSTNYNQPCQSTQIKLYLVKK